MSFVEQPQINNLRRTLWLKKELNGFRVYTQRFTKEIVRAYVRVYNDVSLNHLLYRLGNITSLF